jgi:hypothetical protein
MPNATVAICALFAIAAVVALPVAEIVIGNKYIDDTRCSNARLIKPAGWLVVSGSVALTFIGTIIIMAARQIILNDRNSIIHLFTLQLLNNMFSIAWCIIGAVSLWRDNLQCEPNEMHDMMWAAVIIHLILVALSLLTTKKSDE